MKLIKKMNYVKDFATGRRVSREEWFIVGGSYFRGIGASSLEEMEFSGADKPTGLPVSEYPTEEDALRRLKEIEEREAARFYEDVKFVADFLGVDHAIIDTDFAGIARFHIEDGELMRPEICAGHERELAELVNKKIKELL